MSDPNAEPISPSQKSERARHIYAAMMDGRSLREIAEAEGLGIRRIQQIVAEELARRKCDRATDYALLQIARLEQAQELLSAKIDAGEAAAVPAFLRVIEQLSKLTERQLHLGGSAAFRLADEADEMEERFERLAIAREVLAERRTRGAARRGKTARSRTPRKSLKSQQTAKSSISRPNNIKDLRAAERNVFLSQAKFLSSEAKFSPSQAKFPFRFGVDFDERHFAAKGFRAASRCFPAKRTRRRRLRRRDRFNPASRFLRLKDNRRISSLAKIGPPFPRDPLRLLPPPISDARVIAGQQHVGNAPPLPFARARVMGIFEPARLETLLLARFGSPHDAGKQPDAGVEHRERRDLAARKNIVADRDLDQAARPDDPLVGAFEARTDDHEPRPRRPFACAPLREWLAARAHDQPRTRIVRRQRRVEAGGEHVGAHHHARPAAGRRVVDRAMAAEAMLANIPRLERPQPARQRVARERKAERAGEHLREQSQQRAGEHRRVVRVNPAGRKPLPSRGGRERVSVPVFQKSLQTKF